MRKNIKKNRKKIWNIYLLFGQCSTKQIHLFYFKILATNTMLKNSYPMSWVIMALLICLTIQQLSVQLEYSKVEDDTDSTYTSRHHLLRQQAPRRHKKSSWISHNVKYINHYFQTLSKPTHQLHKLNQQSNVDHLKIQTFKLEPNTYSFSLPMKIAGINYKMSIDSGSSDIFIKGEKSKGKPKIKYQCGDVCINTHDKYKIGYLDGYLLTYESNLQVEIGDHKFNESILVAYKADDNFKSNQGLIGLSFPKLASNPNPTFLQTLKNQKIIDVYAFGVNLNFQQKSKSFITFGSYDNKFFEGQLDFLDLSSNLFYYTAAQGVSFGDSELLKVKTALFDTGNTCISIPKKYEQNILSQFKKQKDGKQNECYFSLQQNAKMFSLLRCKVQSFDLLPVLNIHLNGKKYPIEKQFYLQACDLRPKQSSKDQGRRDSGVWYCDTYIESVSRMGELFLGDGFFNRYYTYFNLEKSQLGIAKNKEVITVDRIIKNQLDVNAEDWQNILTNLNPKQSASDIKKQLKQSFGQKKSNKNTKKNEEQ